MDISTVSVIRYWCVFCMLRPVPREVYRPECSPDIACVNNTTLLSRGMCGYEIYRGSTAILRALIDWCDFVKYTLIGLINGTFHI